MLVAWSTPDEYPELSGPVIGVASSEPVEVEDDQLALVSGQVVLDTEQMADVLRFNSGRAVAVATITHELGHLVGLGHVQGSPSAHVPQRASADLDLPGAATSLGSLRSEPAAASTTSEHRAYSRGSEDIVTPTPKCIIDRSRPCGGCVADSPAVCPYVYLLRQSDAMAADAVPAHSG